MSVPFLATLRSRIAQPPAAAPFARALAGHSHYHNTKHRKAAVDAKRQARLQALSRGLYAAIAVGGRDPALNPRLARAVEDARKGGLPRSRIDRALQGQTGRPTVEPATFELVFPARVAALVRAEPSQTVSTKLRSIARRAGGALDSAAWRFATRLAVVVAAVPSADVQRAVDVAIDAGASDIETHGSGEDSGAEDGGVAANAADDTDAQQLVFLCDDRAAQNAVARAMNELYGDRDDVPVFTERDTYPVERVTVDDEEVAKKLRVAFDAIHGMPQVVELLHNAEL